MFSITPNVWKITDRDRHSMRIVPPLNFTIDRVAHHAAAPRHHGVGVFTELRRCRTNRLSVCPNADDTSIGSFCMGDFPVHPFGQTRVLRYDNNQHPRSADSPPQKALDVAFISCPVSLATIDRTIPNILASSTQDRLQMADLYFVFLSMTNKNILCSRTHKSLCLKSK